MEQERYNYAYKKDCNNYPLTMELNGSGSIMAKPDKATINIGVETINSNLKDAQEKNAIITNDVIISLKRLGIEDKDIQTSTYNINKEYDYIDGKQIDKGFKVSNILNITIENIGLIGQIVDTAVKNGANVVRNIKFELEDSSYYYNKALNLAISDALEKSKSIGRNLNIKIFNIPLKIIEESYSIGPVYETLYNRSKDFATPIEVGENEIIAKVKVLIAYY